MECFGGFQTAGVQYQTPASANADIHVVLQLLNPKKNHSSDFRLCLNAIRILFQQDLR